MIKHSKRYTYIQGKQLTDPGSGTRMYEISNYKLPSVTTVLGATKNQDFIKKWKAKVGEVEATRIKDHASSRGTAMHKYLEHYVLGTNIIDLTPIGQEARPMADKIIEMGLAPVDEYYGSEVMLAHDYVYGSHIKQGVIMVCTPDLYYQEFKVEGLQLRKWKHAFLKRLDMYNELKFDDKEKAKVDTTSLLKEFEKDKS